MRVKAVKFPAPPKPVDPDKIISKPPRIRAAATRNYGKGQPSLASAPEPGKYGFKFSTS